MAESVIKSGIKKYVLPKKTFTFSGYYQNLGNYSNVAPKSRVVGVYISGWGGNNCPLSVALGNSDVYAIGTPNGQIVDLEVTIAYI